MEIDKTLWFLLLTLIAEIIGTIGGFGSSVFFVPFANIFFDFHTVLGITAIFHLSSNLSKIYLFRKGLNKKLILQIGIPSVIFVIIGGFLSKFFESQILEIALGIFLIALSLLFLIKDKLVIPAKFKQTVLGGALSGFSAGLIGTGGAIRGLTMAAFNLEKSVFVATSAAIDMMIDLSRTFVYYSNGYITKDILIYIPFLFIIGFVGSWIGQKILKYISQDYFKRISLFLILIIGIFSLYQSLK
ncbi:sulfite exporter TauE/SafE family protein [Flavobacterium azooxidireducens]|uniref:Probable membrane transporter protein n=1 Tax=Flavobacterium azooxidireducens TaxID=1871076 RepID=A0ABY4KDV2_9FLAO|nr:sulfite exporter TauE/SafE family protein [Flavobacterium azooxidireducens]UPQ78957.1 sulfite exporter TauE/SafE family protein [Flavobacterium azooxidireducens]